MEISPERRPMSPASLSDRRRDERSPTDEKTGNAHSASPERTIKGIRWVLLASSVLLGTFLFGLDATIVADIQEVVFQDFGELQKLLWLGLGFVMGATTTVLIYGQLFSLFDTKWVYVPSVILFEIGSAVCGASPSMNALIVGRVIAGIGGGGLYLGSLVYFNQLTTSRERSTYLALVTAVWGLGMILGPVIGGSFSESSASWRWSFYINLCLFAVCVPAYIFVLPQVPSLETDPWWSKIKRLDFVGLGLNTASCVLLFMALAFSGGQWDWDAPGTIVLWILAGLTIVAFGLQQYYSLFTNNRIFPGQLLKNKEVLLCATASAGSTVGFNLPLFYVPLVFQFTRGLTAIETIIPILPLVIPFVFVVLLAGMLASYMPRYAATFLASGLLITLGGALVFGLLSPTLSSGAIYGFEIILAVGSGLTFQLGYSVVPLKVSPEDVTSAMGLVNLVQVGGACANFAIAGCIFNNKGFQEVRNALSGLDYGSSEIRSILAGTSSALITQLDQSTRDRVTEGIVKTLAEAFVLPIVAGILTILCAFGMSWAKPGPV